MNIFDQIRKIGFRRGPGRLVAGIAGGIAEKFTLNVWLVRLLVLLSFLLPVIGWVFYVAVWIVTPWKDGSIPIERWIGKRQGPVA